MAKPISRKELYELVWSKPLTQIAKEFDISDVAFAKVVRKYGIPLPGRGYWAKIRAGMTPDKVPLPDLLPGQDDRTSLSALPAGPQKRETELATDRPTFHESLSEVRAKAISLAGKVILKKELSAPHAVLRHMLAADKQRKERRATTRFPSFYDEPYFDSPFEKRRLRILNSLLLAAERIGYECSTPDGRKNPFLFLLQPNGGAPVRFTLEAPKVKPRSNLTPHYPSKKPASDPIELVIEWQSGLPPATDQTLQWTDRPGIPIEDQLTEILAELLVTSEASLRALKIHWFEEDQRAAQRRAEARKRAKEAEERAIKEAEEQRVQAALDEIKRKDDRLVAAAEWHAKAEGIRILCDAVERRSPEAPDAAEWLRWARARADALDPVHTGHLPYDSQ